MTRKKKPTTGEAIADRPVETAPVVTPEIEDGYNGTVKRLVCTGCQRVFYLAATDYQSLQPTHCHPCSTKLVAEYEARRHQEATEQEQKAKDEIILALVADLVKQDTPEEAFVRAHVESTFKNDWRYGYKMLMCSPLHGENTRAWKVVQDDWTYGKQRHFEIDAIVGHSDSVNNPSHFTAENNNGQIIVIELPGGNVAKARFTRLKPSQETWATLLSSSRFRT